jgi:aryl-alcohol dehydrogenase-like predicted oxidoreductase
MQKRKLGTQGLEVPVLGLGCMGMTFAYRVGTTDPNECLKVLDRTLELGMNFWDTAQSYGPFTNEELLAKALKGRREKVIVATKFAWKDGKASPDNLDGSEKNARESLEGCLKRLGTDHVDIYYLHRMDPKTPIEESVGAMSKLVKEGKVKYLGLSEVGPNTLRKANAVHPISVLQSEYSLWENTLEERVIPVLRELGIGLVAFSPVGRGFLTGQIRQFEDIPEGDMRRNLPRFQGENFKLNIQLVEEIKKIGATKGITASQAALGWVLSRGKDVVAIPGTTHVHHLEENAKAAGSQLSTDDLNKINTLLSQFKISGNRYNEAMAKMVSFD